MRYHLFVPYSSPSFYCEILGELTPTNLQIKLLVLLTHYFRGEPDFLKTQLQTLCKSKTFTLQKTNWAGKIEGHYVVGGQFQIPSDVPDQIDPLNGLMLKLNIESISSYESYVHKRYFLSLPDESNAVTFLVKIKDIKACPLEMQIIDVVGNLLESIGEKLEKLLQAESFKLESLDPVGVTIEKWDIIGQITPFVILDKIPQEGLGIQLDMKSYTWTKNK